MPPAAIFNSFPRYRIARPRPNVTHPDRDYRILCLQAGLPSGLQHIDICFHHDFEPDARLLTLHLGSAGVTVTTPLEIDGAAPLGGLIVDCGRVDLFCADENEEESEEENEEDSEESEDESDDEERQQTVTKGIAKRHVVITLIALSIIAIILTIYSTYTTTTPTNSSITNAFPPLEYIIQSTIAIPCIAFNLFFSTDYLTNSTPSSIQQLRPPPPHTITNTNTASLVQKALETIINIISDRLAVLPDTHPLDTEAVVCGQSRDGLILLNSLVRAYKTKATALWESSVQNIGVTASLDLEHQLTQLYELWLELDLGSLDANLFASPSPSRLGPAALELMASYKSHFKWLASYQFSSWLLQECARPQHLAPDYILQPFCAFATADPSHYQHDNLVNNLRHNLTSWILETEGQRLRQSQFHVELTDWSKVHEVFQLAYYVTGFHALSSHVIDISHQVQACKAEWTQQRQPLWSRVISSIKLYKEPQWYRFPHNPAILPATTAELSAAISGPLDAQVTRTLNAAISLIKEAQRLDQATQVLELMQSIKGWKAGGYDGSKKQAERLWKAREALRQDTNELVDGYNWWVDREAVKREKD